MNSDVVVDSWFEQKGRLKQKLVKLIGNDMLFFDSKKDQLISILQLKLGKNKEEIEKLLKEI